jgi:hypothetical protein
MSVVERIFERIEAFDTATVGTTQLIHKAHLRTYSIDKLRSVLAMPDDNPQKRFVKAHGYDPRIQTIEV